MATPSNASCTTPFEHIMLNIIVEKLLLNFIFNMSTKLNRSATAVLCELVKLKSQQKYLESSQLPIHLNGLCLDDMASVTEINNLQEQLHNQIPAFKLNLKNELETVLGTISSFKSIMTNPDDILQYNTKVYRDRIILIDQTFRNIFQNNIKHLSLLKKEFCELETTVLPANYLLNETIKICPNVTNVTRTRLIKPIDKEDNVDVQKFDDFLAANSGHTGGWNDEEHYLFLKIKSKYKENIDQIILSIKHITGSMKCDVKFSFNFLHGIIVLDKTEEDIRKHNQWYMKYVELKEKKKIAIKNWNDSRMEVLQSNF